MGALGPAGRFLSFTFRAGLSGAQAVWLQQRMVQTVEELIHLWRRIG